MFSPIEKMILMSRKERDSFITICRNQSTIEEEEKHKTNQDFLNYLRKKFL